MATLSLETIERHRTFVAENRNEILQQATRRAARDGKTDMVVSFGGYAVWDADNNYERVSFAEDGPVFRSGDTKKGGKWYKTKFKGNIVSVAPRNNVCTIDNDAEGTFHLVCKVAYSSDALSLLSGGDFDDLSDQSRATIDRFIDPETGKPRTTIQVTLKRGQYIDISVMGFTETCASGLSKKNKSYADQITQISKLQLEEAEGHYYVRTFQTRNGETVIRDDFSVQCSEVKNVVPNPSLTAIQLLQEIYDVNEYPLVPIEDVLEYRYRFPNQVYFYVQDNFVSPAKNYMRSVIPPDTTDEETFQFKNSQTGQTVRQIQWTLEDLHAQETGDPRSYVSIVTARDNVCEDMGLDMKYWKEWMTAHPLVPTHILAAYYQKGTLKIKQNDPANIAMRSAGDKFGYFSFFINFMIPDWAVYLAENGLKLTKKEFLDDFRSSNAGKKGKSKKFRETDDGYLFRHAESEGNNIATNKLHRRGVNSSVLNFGNGDRPMVEMDEEDSQVVLSDARAMFFALTSLTPTQTKGKTFAELKEALPNLRYQLFVVRDGRIVLPKKKDKKKRRQK